MDTCPVRVNVVDAEAAESIRAVVVLEAVEDTCPERRDAAVDNWSERMDAADAEASRPSRIETAVVF